MANKKALVDSRATDNFMHPTFAKRMGLGMKTLPKPKKIFNIDNTTNKSGMITHYLDLDVVTKGVHKEMCFLITDIGQEEVLLGYPWLATFEPKSDWIHATSLIPRVTLHLEQLKTAWDQARSFMIKAQQSWVKHHDTPKYKEGDLVWLEGKNLRINQPTIKLAPRRHGPFKVIQVMSAVNYQLELPTQWCYGWSAVVCNVHGVG
jgi:hypothetical protein